MSDTQNPARPAFAGAGDGSADPGLSKRELIAAMALQGLLANEDGSALTYTSAAGLAVQHADALLEALER